MKWQLIKISKLAENPANPRSIDKEKFEKLVASIKEFPEMLELRPIVVNSEYQVLGGNMRLKACIMAGLKEVPIVYADNLTPEQQKEFIIKDNVSFGEWDWEMLADDWDLEEMENWGLDVEFPTETESEKQVARIKLSETFGVPPFSVLDSRQGYWVDRKRSWRTLITDEGKSREGVLAENSIMSELNDGVSIFDPVLAELIVRWFAPPKALICDPFSGGAFGFVASYLGNLFTGIELRQEQAEINHERVKQYGSRYICEDGQNIAKHLEAESQDLIFSCPPYFDLEVYSDLANDASNQKTYKGFLSIIENGFKGAISCLKDNRFAVVVCGDIRDKKGFYYGFPDDIKAIFKRHGMKLYNEMFLVESLGTLPQRVRKSMGNRKVGKCHQNVLVFYKGDPKQIQANFPEIEISQLDKEEENGL